MSGVFISYAREDRTKVAALAKALEDLGWQVWRYLTTPAGKTWHQIISEALETGDCWWSFGPMKPLILSCGQDYSEATHKRSIAPCGRNDVDGHKALCYTSLTAT